MRQSALFTCLFYSAHEQSNIGGGEYQNERTVQSLMLSVEL